MNVLAMEFGPDVDSLGWEVVRSTNTSVRSDTAGMNGVPNDYSLLE